MIRVSGMYRWEEGAHFDHAYYASTHMDLARKVLLPLGLVRLESDRFLTHGAPKPGQIIAATNAYFPSLEIAQAAMAQAGKTLAEHLPNYTSLQPQMHISEVSTHV